MSDKLETRRETASTYAPPSGRDALLFEALSSTINGKPLPEGLRAPAHVAPGVATAEEGLRRIVEGPRPR